MSEQPQDLCVIGAGIGGFTAAALAAQLGARVTLIERAAFGGSLLKGALAVRALMASATSADNARRAPRFGVGTGPVTVDMAGVRAHLRRVIEGAAPNLSEARAAGLGVTVLKGSARFTAADAVTVDETVVKARRFVIATGAQPLVPAIPGLEAVPYLSELTALELDRLPRHLIVIGGEPAGIEIAQAFRRLGAAVTVIAAAGILAGEDEEAVDVVRSALQRDGVDLVENAALSSVERKGDGVSLSIAAADGTRRIDGSDLLVNAGRRPAIAGLDLAVAGVEASDAGIVVDAGLRTANPRIYAIGDCLGGGLAHVAADHAAVIVRNALFRLPAKPSAVAPRVVFTAPELARVGLTEAEARRATADLVVLRWPFAENDRARAEETMSGMIKVLTTRNGRLLGVTMAGPQAGELIGIWSLAVRKGLRVNDIADTPMAYPTFGDVSGRVAHSAFMLRLLSPVTRGLVRLIARIDRPLRK